MIATTTIAHCGNSYAGTWRHGLWKITRTENTGRTQRTDGSYHETKEEAEKAAARLEDTK